MTRKATHKPDKSTTGPYVSLSKRIRELEAELASDALTVMQRLAKEFTLSQLRRLDARERAAARARGLVKESRR